MTMYSHGWVFRELPAHRAISSSCWMTSSGTASGLYWRACPTVLSCEITSLAFARLSISSSLLPVFLADQLCPFRHHMTSRTPAQGPSRHTISDRASGPRSPENICPLAEERSAEAVVIRVRLENDAER